MDKIKLIFANLNKLDAGLIISAVILAVGIVIALIVFGVQQWRWIVGIGVPMALLAVDLVIIYQRYKKAVEKIKALQG
jgi:MFS family permease